MKKPYLWTAIISCIFLSCSQDTDELTTQNGGNTARKKALLAAERGPENSLNPYDKAGEANNALLDGYVNAHYTGGSIGNVGDFVITLAADNAYLVSTKSIPLVPTAEIATLIATSPADYHLAIANLGMSSDASLSFSGFLTDLIVQQNNDYSALYNFIYNYEASVMAATTFTVNDKTILLTATSITRYSIYRKKRKDRDWDTSVANVLAAASGARENTISAVCMSVTTDMSIDEGITN